MGFDSRTDVFHYFWLLLFTLPSSQIQCKHVRSPFRGLLDSFQLKTCNSCPVISLAKALCLKLEASRTVEGIE